MVMTPCLLIKLGLTIMTAITILPNNSKTCGNDDQYGYCLSTDWNDAKCRGSKVPGGRKHRRICLAANNKAYLCGVMHCEGANAVWGCGGPGDGPHCVAGKY